MKEHAILSALGPDHCGIANDLSATLEQYGLAIETSRMATLEGRFAVLMEVSGEQSGFTKLSQNLASLRAGLGFDLRVDRLDRKEVAPKVRPIGRETLIESFSSEPTGWSAITGILKRHCINIEELETEVSSAPCTSRMTFHMRARVDVPTSYSLEELGKELRELELGRDLDIKIKPGRRAPLKSSVL